ncbi:SRPBCC family protein [Amycolatopsis sp. H20-H5]|uniref:SRPBCC family protein n=1 Tax=Amycolatopsis sp. H20-H5 TaxID=3046309 RepID=UPI002DBBADEF|nr:SRPBCC family protein [Amycolatopsis sp. H20-H5]MEC3979299.1 SRPBCC family protein [Amycolatopsis sp. H20-H5]
MLSRQGGTTGKRGSVKSFGFAIKRSYPATPAIIFDILSDVPEWKRWAWPLILSSKWEKLGTDTDGGLDSVRSAGIWPFLIRERITEYEPGKKLSYCFVGRVVPVKDYHATVTLEENGGGTDLSWTSSFAPLVPGSGRLLEQVVRLPVLFMVWRLKKAARRKG